jgi:hypothetical protein
MAFILTKDRAENSQAEWQRAWAAYCEYLASIRHLLPQRAYDFAIASWHYDFSDHRSPLDAWLESLTINETGKGERQQHRSVQIAIHLLGAYHDGQIEISYGDVRNYSIVMLPVSWEDNMGERDHRDWLYDEVRLSEQGNVLHEIEWSGGSSWVIEAKDIVYRWRGNV